MNKGKLAHTFNYSYRYIDNVLSLSNSLFGDYLHRIYPNELEVKDTTDTQKSAYHLDLIIEIDNEARLKTKLYAKRDDFPFLIVNFLFISSNIPASSAYGVYAQQLIRYSIVCAKNSDVLYRTQPLTQKLIKQGCAANRLKSSLHNVYGGHPNLVDRCEI